MTDKGSVTKLLEPLRRGDSRAVEELWRRYFQRMSAAARTELVGDYTAVADEEDAALSALRTFCQRFQEGQFTKIASRNDLWSMLVVLTRRKVARQRRHATRQKRGGGLRRVPLGCLSADDPEGKGWSKIEDKGWASILHGGLDARCQELLELLPDESLQRVAIRKLEGYTNKEIAAQLGIAERSVERKLKHIRAIWEAEASDD